MTYPMPTLTCAGSARGDFLPAVDPAQPDLAGLTQAAFADRLGVAKNTVTRWEQGVHAITEPMARRIWLTLTFTKAKGKGRN